MHSSETDELFISQVGSPMSGATGTGLFSSRAGGTSKN